MTKLHITTNVNFGYKPKDTGLNIAEDNTRTMFCYECEDGGYGCDGCRGIEIDVYLAGVVKAFANYTGILMANGKHVTLHYGDTTTLPEGLFFDMPVVVKVVGVSESKAGECLVVEILVPGHKTITEQI